MYEYTTYDIYGRYQMSDMDNIKKVWNLETCLGFSSMLASNVHSCTLYSISTLYTEYTVHINTDA